MILAEDGAPNAVVGSVNKKNKNDDFDPLGSSSGRQERDKSTYINDLCGLTISLLFLSHLS